jgi:type I restriction enzyme S subunit
VEGKTWLYQNQSTGISNFQTTVFLEKEILTLPPLILLEEFEKIITPIIKKIDSSERLFLSNLRDTLLPKLLSGELDVSGLQGEGIDG